MLVDKSHMMWISIIFMIKQSLAIIRIYVEMGEIE